MTEHDEPVYCPVCDFRSLDADRSASVTDEVYVVHRACWERIITAVHEVRRAVLGRAE